ncbi:MAG: sulfatase-like hydrolase/transferase [Acidobacteriota bacterium]
MARRAWVRELAACVSLSNICFYKTWAAILEWKQVTPAAFLIAIANVLMLGLLMWGGLRLLRRSGGWISRVVGMAVAAVLALVMANGITSVHFATKTGLGYACGALAAAVMAALSISSRCRRIFFHALLVLAPFTAVTFGQALWRASTYDPSAWKPHVAGRLPGGGAGRVVWLLFDEWDYGLTFAERCAGLRLPELDRLRSEAFTAANAVPPGTTTSTSVPVLLTGVHGAGVDTLRSASTVFSRARQAGADTAIAGWFLDYCGSMGRALSDCVVFNMNTDRNSMGRAPGEIAANQLRNLIETQFRSPLGQTLAAARHAEDYRFILQAAGRATADRGLGLVFVHWPVPHEPFFYDSSRGAFDLSEGPVASMVKKDFTRYNDALELLDVTLGKLRRGMEEAGVWEETAVLVTSDHPYRNRRRVDGRPIDRRVPFLLKLPGQHSGFSYTPEFNTAVSHDVVLELLAGRLRTAADTCHWLDARRDASRAPAR